MKKFKRLSFSNAPLSILQTNPAEKISFPVGYVIGLSHHSPLSILQTKPRKCFFYSANETILPNHSNFHMATGDSPFHHAGGMQIFQFHFQFLVVFVISRFLVFSFLAF